MPNTNIGITGADGRAAFAAALATLRQRHADEFAQLQGDEREARGLPRESSSRSPDELRALIARAEQRIAKYKQLIGEG